MFKKKKGHYEIQYVFDHANETTGRKYWKKIKVWIPDPEVKTTVTVRRGEGQPITYAQHVEQAQNAKRDAETG